MSGQAEGDFLLDHLLYFVLNYLRAIKPLPKHILPYGIIPNIYYIGLQAPNYCVRKLDVTRSSKGGLGGEDNGRVIVHLQLTDWPDR